MSALDDLPVTFVGHPFAPIGMGEQLRSHLSAASRVLIDWGVLDIFRYAQRSDPVHFATVGTRELTEPRGGIRVFHINGDEVESVLAAFAARGGDFDAGYNIIAPAWELPIYPKQWAAQLARFDEVWALSDFLRESFATAGLRSYPVGQAVQTEPGALLPRRAFGIRESAFVLLHFFDLSSYATRKNPSAVLELLRRLRREMPFADLQLVLKVKNGERPAEDWARSLDLDGHVKVIDAPLDTFGVRSLIAACDCFVSLHRAEGFGRGLGEAMALGRLAMGTGWSGNLDFMTPENSLLVRQRLVPVGPDEYPFGRGQEWAEADLDHAVDLLRPVLADPARGGAIARRGQGDVLRSHGDRAVGLRMLERLEAAASSVKFAPKPARAKRAAASAAG
jgi:glycosyltransferase involved in cell wall biosynthesis